MEKLDIVYVLKKDVEPNELIYSLRSVEANMPHARVIFVGGKPDGIEPDVYIPHEQKGVSNWEKSTSSIEYIARRKEVSDNFWLFNDDFFVMKPIDELKPIYNGTLYRRVQAIEQKRKGMTSLYSNALRATKELLDSERLHSYNYAVHMPMLINKAKALEVIRKYPKCKMFRSLYGNYHRVGGINRPDCKIVNLDTEPSKDAIFLSTSETSFAKGKVGEFIRSKFTKPSRFEANSSIKLADAEAIES